jgi:predicted Zn-dependent protease
MDISQVLEPPDCHFLSAAVGWLELGNPTEAELELRQIRAAYQDSGPVLNVRWFLYERQRLWDQAQTVADRMRQLFPDDPGGYVHYAYATRRMAGGGISAAWDALEPAAQRFPKEPIIPYNLACYAAQQNQLDEAWIWLQKAMAIGDNTQLRQMALADPDLTALWPRLQARPDADAET